MSDATIKKLDPELRDLLRDIATAAPENAGCFPAEVGIIIAFRGEPADLERVGVTYLRADKHPDGSFMATGRIKTELLSALVAIDHVIAVDGGGRYTPDLNYSVDEIGAVALHGANPAVAGQGVIVGVIDTGIEWRHGAFRDDQGKSRILFIWDQILSATGGAQAGPQGLGVVYTQQQINDALANPAKLKEILTKDERIGDPDGHGSHVAGIAAGDGSAGDCCAKGGTYVGVAPKADLIAVRLNQGSDLIGDSMNLILAMNFIFDQAKTANKAAVINISLGDNIGAHDGTSMVERQIDMLVTQQAGRVVVKSAGNEGEQNHHVQADIPQATAAKPNVEIVFTVALDDHETRYLDFWYENGNELTLEVETPSGVKSGVIAHGADRTFAWNPSDPANKQGKVMVNGTANAAFNNDHNFRIKLTTVSGKALPAGQWKLRFANANAASVSLHGWLQRGAGSPTFLAPDGGGSQVRASKNATISIPGTAKEVISVANWEGRASLLDCCPGRDIAKSSSLGPVRKNAATNQKPTLAAPGGSITSAQANACQLPGQACDCCAERCCALYEVKSGTSMAAPHVAGAVALMFQLNKALTKAQVTSFLEQTAERPAGGDKNSWGAGKINVEKAIERVKQSLPPAPAPLPSPGSGSSSSSRRVAKARPPGARRAPRTPVQAPPLPQLVELLQRRVTEIPEGELWANLVSKHFSEVRRLVNTKRKVAALWHRADGPALLIRLGRGVSDPSAPNPIASDEHGDYLRRMCVQLRRFGSVRLRDALDRHEQLIWRLLERPLAAQAMAHDMRVPA